MAAALRHYGGKPEAAVRLLEFPCRNNYNTLYQKAGSFNFPHRRFYSSATVSGRKGEAVLRKFTASGFFERFSTIKRPWDERE